MSTAELSALAAAWQSAKVAEDEARARRLEIEGQLLAAYPVAGTEGTTHADVAGYKITIVQRLTRSVDTQALQAGWTALPAVVREAFKWSADLDLRQYRALETANKDAFRLASDFVTAKAGKPTVKVEVAQ